MLIFLIFIYFLLAVFELVKLVNYLIRCYPSIFINPTCKPLEIFFTFEGCISAREIRLN